METFFTSLGTYVLIDLISLAILVAFKDKFIRAARYGFEMLNIRPVVNNYNTYRTYSHEEAFSETEDEEEYTGDEADDYTSESDADEDELNSSEEDAEEEEETTSELLERMGGENILYGVEVKNEDDKKPQ